MQVLFESRDAEGASVRPFAVRRVRFALRRLSWLVPRAKVQLSDINGPRGGIDKRCRIEIDACWRSAGVGDGPGARLARGDRRKRCRARHER